MKKAHKRKLLRLLLPALVIAGAAASLIVFGLVCWRANAVRELQAADCIIVLGARVYPDGRMSLVLQSRADAALQAWRDGYAGQLVVCGAQGRDEPRSEADALAEYLVAQGVPEENIHRDDASFDTRQNITNAARIMQENGWERAIIATSDYHLERALWMARDAGIEASGLAAPTPHTFRAYWWGRMRETVSWILYFFRLL